MYTFLVLGIIPGTNIAISFQAWLVITAVLSVLLLAVLPLRQLLSAGQARVARMPLPASQLHLRIRPTAR